jgi:hypothetical protein
VVLVQRLAANAGLGCTHLEPLCDFKQRGLVFLVPARWRGHGSTLTSRGHGAKRFTLPHHSLTNTHTLSHTHTHTHTHTRHTPRKAHRHFSVLGPSQQLSFFWPQVFTRWAQTAPQTAPHTHTPPSAPPRLRKPFCTSLYPFFKKRVPADSRQLAELCDIKTSSTHNASV